MEKLGWTFSLLGKDQGCHTVSHVQTSYTCFIAVKNNLSFKFLFSEIQCSLIVQIQCPKVFPTYLKTDRCIDAQL